MSTEQNYLPTIGRSAGTCDNCLRHVSDHVDGKCPPRDEEQERKLGEFFSTGASPRR